MFGVVVDSIKSVAGVLPGPSATPSGHMEATVAPDSLRGAEQTPVPLHGDLGWPAAKMARVNWSGLARSSYPKLTIPALALSSGVIHYATDGMIPLFELISCRSCLLFIPGA